MLYLLVKHIMIGTWLHMQSVTNTQIKINI